MKKIVLIIALLVASNVVYASGYINGTKISRLYAQSRTGSSGTSASQAHFIEIDKMAEGCANNRLYIDQDDKALFSVALTAYTTGRVFSVYFRTMAEPKTADGHGPLDCKLVSLY